MGRIVESNERSKGELAIMSSRYNERTDLVLERVLNAPRERVWRAWTEAEIGSHEFGRLGNDVLARFTRVLTLRIAEAAPPDLDPIIAALALVAMFERLNYYSLAGQVRADRGELAELSYAEAADFRDGPSALDEVVRRLKDALGLITSFTVGEK